MKCAFWQLMGLLLLVGFVATYWPYIALFVAVFVATLWWLSDRRKRAIDAACRKHKEAALASRADRQARGDSGLYGQYPPAA